MIVADFRMNKIYFFPKYSSKAPSSRYRIYEYLPYYQQAGIKFIVSPLLGDWYLSALWGHKSKFRVLFLIIVTYLKRIASVLFIPHNSIVYIGAELLPYMPSWLESYLHFRGIKYLIEFDDAVFHNYENKNIIIRKLYREKFRKVISKASLVICGCRYLADYSKQWNKNVLIIPTSIDKNKYNKTISCTNNIIGWIGSSTTSPNIKIVIPALKKLSEEFNFELHLIGFDKKYEYLLNGINYRLIDWTSETEVSELSQFTIGIMPLYDTPGNRGKCAFKLVQYMAVGIPTISTPLQSNIDIDKKCGNLFANTEEEWYIAFKDLLFNPDRRNQVGNNNKRVAMQHYTFQSNSQKIIGSLKMISG